MAEVVVGESGGGRNGGLGVGRRKEEEAGAEGRRGGWAEKREWIEGRWRGNAVVLNTQRAANSSDFVVTGVGIALSLIHFGVLRPPVSPQGYPLHAASPGELCQTPVVTL